MPDPPTPQQRDALKQDFRQLLQKVMAVQDPNHLPSVLTKHTDLILSLDGQEVATVVQSLIEEAQATNDEQLVSRLEDAVELTLSFAEDFVDSASSIDEKNKKLLGKILRAMSNKDVPARQREEELDTMFVRERPNFTAGFLRHLEGECNKIARSPVMNPNSARTLEMLRMIQTRVIMEVGEEMGEGALVLGQLIGYEDDAERIAVLEAGLAVRGLDFAMELKELTVEALDGFTRVPAASKVDPQLVRRVQAIDKKIQQFIDKEGDFQ